MRNQHPEERILANRITCLIARATLPEGVRRIGPLQVPPDTEQIHRDLEVLERSGRYPNGMKLREDRAVQMRQSVGRQEPMAALLEELIEPVELGEEVLNAEERCRKLRGRELPVCMGRALLRQRMTCHLHD